MITLLRWRRRLTTIRRGGLGCCLWGLVWAALAMTPRCDGQEPSDRRLDFFRTDVQPLLEKRCYRCHSHAAQRMRGGLALDWRSGWLQGGDSGPAVVPGQPQESLLIEAIRRQGREMPPDEPLSADEVNVLVQWVAQGAVDPRTTPPPSRAVTDAWWSLRPLVRPPLPSPPARARPAAAHPIDAFVDAELDRLRLTPSPPADRRTVIRRLSLDLLGLAPEPSEVKAFIDDPHPLAYEHLVDRLLASPRYGERWARHWLDVVHFADSHGFEHDVFRPHAWRYRDYVIDSLNRDLDWSEFVRQQLAADYFHPDQPQLTPALGFLGAGPLDLSTANTAPVTFAYMDRDDLVTQTMASLVSTTANCARCHDHKFDPISQQDYYALQAVFAGVGKGDVLFDSDPAIYRQREQWEYWLEAASRKDMDVLLTPDAAELVGSWEQAIAQTPVHWRLLPIDVFLSSHGSQLERLDDGSIRAGGPRPDTDIYTLIGSADAPCVTAIKLEVLTDEALPMKGPGRRENGNFHLTEFAADLFAPGAAQPQALSFQRATADFNQSDWTIEHALDGNAATAWGIHPRVGAPHEAVFALEEPLKLPPGARLAVKLQQLHGAGHLIGRLRLWLTGDRAEQAWILPAEVQEILQTPAGQRAPSQRLTLAAHGLHALASWRLSRLPAQVSVFAAAASFQREGKTVRLSGPQEVRMLQRGDIQQPGDVAQSGALSILAPLAEHFTALPAAQESARRAALAQWVVDPRNPLAWRSIANRIWHYHFGKGLCDTPNDLGRMGGEPSHPRLLDWLACELRDRGGSLKTLHRLIVTSNAYRRSGASRADSAAGDQDNRYLWKFSSRRLDADTYRDAVLQASGNLQLTYGGPGVQHFTTSPGQQQTPQLDYTSFPWSTPGAGRRSIYRVVWRGIPDPFMETLDFPDLGLVSPRRTESVSAIQSLALWNNPFVLYHSQLLASRVQREQRTPIQQVHGLFQRLVQREPQADELRSCIAYLRVHGLAALARVLLNSNELIYVD